MKPFYFLFIGLLFISFSCRKDNITDVPVVNEPEPGVVAFVKGIIYDEDLKPISNAVVSLGSTIINSDVNGVFQFEEIGIDSEGSMIRVDANGYFSNYKFVRSDLGNTAHIKIGMAPRAEPKSFMTAQGGKIEGENISISFPPNSIAFEGGAPYEGRVLVYSHWFDPTADDLHLTMPGDLRGTNSQNELVQLATFGMMAVELESEDGAKLQLAPGSKAELNFNLVQ